MSAEVQTAAETVLSRNERRVPWRTVAAMLTLGAGAFAVGQRYGARVNSPPPSGPNGRAEPRAHGAVSGAPTFDPPTVDLGEHLWGKIVPVELCLANRGRTARTIQSVSSSCDCAVPGSELAAGRVVQAGERIEATACVDTQKSPGRKRRIIEVAFTDGTSCAATLDLRVKGEWSLSPDVLDFGEVILYGPELPAPRIIQFSSEQDQLIDVGVSGAPWLEVAIESVDAGRAEIVVQLVPERLSVGQNSATILVRTSNAFRPDAVVFVKARGAHALLHTPEQVILLGTRRRRVEFFDRANKHVRIVSADGGQTALRAAILEDGAVEFWFEGTDLDPMSVPVLVSDETGRSTVFRISWQGATRTYP